MVSACLPTLHGGWRSLRDKGAAVIALLTVIGMVGAAIQLAMRWYLPTYADGWVGVGVTAVLWTAGSSIALNMLVDDVDMARLVSLSETSYRGLFWTTTNMLIGAAAYTLVVGVATLPLLALLAAPTVSWLPVVTVHALPPATAALFMLVASVLGAAPAYVAVSAMLFPVFVGVENRNAYQALRESVRVVRGHRVALLPVLLLALFALLGAPAAGMRYAPLIVAQVPQQLPWPVAVMLVEQFVAVLFAATGTVTALALVAAAYGAVVE